MIKLSKKSVYLNIPAWIVFIQPTFGYASPSAVSDLSDPPVSIPLLHEAPWANVIQRVVNLKDQSDRQILSGDQLKKAFRSIYSEFSSATRFLKLDAPASETENILSEIKQLLKEAALGAEPYSHLVSLTYRGERLLSESRIIFSEEVPSDEGDQSHLDPMVSDHVVLDIDQEREMVAIDPDRTYSKEELIKLIKTFTPWIPVEFFTTKELVALKLVFPEHVRHWKKELNNRVSPVWDLVDPHPRVPLLALSGDDRLKYQPGTMTLEEYQDSLIRANLKPICEKLNVRLVNYSVVERNQKHFHLEKVNVFDEGTVNNLGIRSPIKIDRIPLSVHPRQPRYHWSRGAQCLGLASLAGGVACMFLNSEVGLGLWPGLVGLTLVFCCCSGCSSVPIRLMPHLVFETLYFQHLGPKPERLREGYVESVDPTPEAEE